MTIQQLRQVYTQRKAQALSTYAKISLHRSFSNSVKSRLAIKTRESQNQQHQMQQMNPALQGQMQAQMNGMPNVQNPVQIQHYQQMLQQQRANQARSNR